MHIVDLLGIETKKALIPFFFFDNSFFFILISYLKIRSSIIVII